MVADVLQRGMAGPPDRPVRSSEEAFQLNDAGTRKGRSGNKPSQGSTRDLFSYSRFLHS